MPQAILKIATDEELSVSGLIILCLFLAIPVTEIAIFIAVGKAIGIVTTVALVIITTLVGASLVKSQGIKTVYLLREKMQQGEVPRQEIIEGVMLALAGALLIIPGFFTDFIGILFLLPPLRHALAKLTVHKMSVQIHGHNYQAQHSNKPNQGNVYEGEVESENKDDKNLPKH